MNMRATIRNHISFSAHGQPIFNTIYPLELYVQNRGQDVVVFLTTADSEVISDGVAGWVGDSEQKIRASIKDVAAKLIERTKYYAGA